MFLVSGDGGLLKFVYSCIEKGFLPDHAISAVIADRECGAFNFAKEKKLDCQIVKYNSSARCALMEAMQETDFDIAITTIYKILDANIVSQFRGRLINVHPSLLPAFGGVFHAVEDALAHGVKFVGTTVHYVDEGADTGEIIAQSVMPLKPEDTLETTFEHEYRAWCLNLLNVLLLRSGHTASDQTVQYEESLFNPPLRFDISGFTDSFWNNIRSRNATCDYLNSSGRNKNANLGGGNYVYVYLFGTNSLARILAGYIQEDPRYCLRGITVNRSYCTSDEFYGYPLIPFEDLAFDGEDVGILNCVGYSDNSRNRANTDKAILEKGFRLLNYVHPTALVANTRFGSGNIVMNNVVIEQDSIVGDGNIFYGECYICHDAKIGDYNWFSAGCALAGGVIVGERNFIGINVSVRQNIKIGSISTVGMGAVVVTDVPDEVTLAGNPARAINR